MSDNQFKPTHSGTPPEPPKDARVQITKSIWALSTAMMGISIPIVGITNSPLLPLCVLGAAAVSTVAVWLGGKVSAQGQADKSLREQLQQMEDRLANVETMTRFERGLIERDASSGLDQALPQAQESSRPTPRSSTPISY
jgi:hypothetical protein